MRTLAVLSLAVLSSCSAPPSMMEDAGNARFQVRESLNQLHVTRAQPAAPLAVHDASGRVVATGTTDAQGSLVFRRLPAGEGYTVRTTSAASPERSRALRVRNVDGSTPPQDFYKNQKLVAGYQYITTRDGTTLSAYVTLPGEPAAGPFPTVVAYSGYSPSKPGMPLGNYEALCKDLPALCDAPNDPAALLAALLGYATVSVNVRGTGCSGGAFDYFEALQVTDGYDVIETVAAQPWVQHGKVGMVGLSYPGISQLFVARSRPPSLAAITPLSVIGSTDSTLVPGGILNDGFAIQWITSVLSKADPYGQGWEKGRADGGDQVCAENQLLHSQRVDNIEMARRTPFYVAELIDPLNPTKFVEQIEVPVFLACQWQDEQTGPFFTTLLDRFTRAPVTRFTVGNGVHADAFAPQVLGEWAAFLDLFVARRVPKVKPTVRTLAPLLFQRIYGANLSLPPDRFTQHATHEAALAAWKAEPGVRAIFESGAKLDEPGAPEGAFVKTFAKWPPPETEVLRLHLGDGGKLTSGKPTAPGASSWKHDPEAGKRGILAAGGSIDDRLPKWDWRQPAAGSAAVFESEPFAADAVMVGTGSADLWIRSTATEADLEVTLSELRPDGKEVFVQNGWLRASHRKTGGDSTALFPRQTHLEADAAPLVPGAWTEVRVAIAGFGHAFRAGSRVRVMIDTPGDSRAAWRFDLAKVPAETVHAVAHGSMRPSSIALPLLPGVKAPSPLPACPSLRGQPCRMAVSYSNTPTN